MIANVQDAIQRERMRNYELEVENAALRSQLNGGGAMQKFGPDPEKEAMARKVSYVFVICPMNDFGNILTVHFYL